MLIGVIMMIIRTFLGYRTRIMFLFAPLYRDTGLGALSIILGVFALVLVFNGQNKARHV